MGLNIDEISEKMVQLFKNIEVDEGMKTLGNLKEDLNLKGMYIDTINKELKKHNGKFTKKLRKDLEKIENDFVQLYENFDDKLMLFIVGNGNAGKSTLLNALVGEKIAVTGTLPSTWKIDVYSPEIKKDRAIIKYVDGRKLELPIVDVQNLINEEENKTKMGKMKIKEEKRLRMKSFKTKEEREEMKKYIEESFGYTSDVSEVRWPVPRNWILDKCLLVDTPGLNQNLNDTGQIGNIYSYYHKADGVIWLLDGQTIAAQNANKAFEELGEELNKFSDGNAKVRDNIIGVVNRIDLVKQNGGNEAVDNVMKDAKKFFEDKFCKIIGLSAFKAETGILEKNKTLLQESNILNLQEKIKEIFIAKSESMKNGAKLQGHNRLVKSTLIIVGDYEKEIMKYENIYIEKNKKIKKGYEEIREELKESLQGFIQRYLIDVESNVARKIDRLAEGEKQDFIIREMYEIDKFKRDLQKFISNKKNEIANKGATWIKLAKISEYKYIEVENMAITTNIAIDSNLYIGGLDDIKYFTPSKEDDLFSLVGNFLGRGMFMFRKNSIKEKINKTIKNKAWDINREILEMLNKTIDNYEKEANGVLDKTFELILFEYENIDEVKNSLNKLRENMDRDKDSVKLEEIIF